MKTVTQRLVIRNLCDSDYPEFERTLNDVQKNCMGSGNAFLNWIISQYADMDIKKGLLCFGMFDKETDKLLGTIGIGRHDDLNETEIFYFLLPEYRGNGFTTEAAMAVTQWAFNHYSIPYLIGTASVDNIKSQKVLERCGYQYIETKSLLVHVTNERYDFKYYRYYPSKKV